VGILALQRGEDVNRAKVETGEKEVDPLGEK